MATIKKTEKKPAVKKAVTKVTATKVTATKTKAAASKTTAAKAAAKKPAAKPVAKKPAAKKPAVKKPAVKAAAKKPAVKKPAAKSAEKKPAAKTTAVKRSAVKSIVNIPAETQQLNIPVEVIDPNVKYRDLFEAFKMGKLPFSQGYIISSFFSATSAYSIYEIVSYAGVKEIFPTGDGLQFVTGGKKLHILVEPDTYHYKPVEPVSRAEGERIPKRFNELETIIAKNQSRIMVAKEPIETYGSFTILRPQGINFAVVFYQLPDMYESMIKFFEDSLNRQRKIPQSDARKAAQFIIEILRKHMGFEGEYS